MRYIVLIISMLYGSLTLAQEWEDRQMFGDETARQTIRVLSSTDTSFFLPIINSFVAKNPNIGVEYLVSGTANIDEIYRKTPDAFDVIISSAMDLQLKLVNDGFAQNLDGIQNPDWAQWRESLYAFTAEPAAIVINRAAFAGVEVPQTRQDLIRALRARPEIFRNRLGTYDVRRSGLGYLFATQDARASETYWRLTEVMGNLGTQLYCCSGEMIDDLVSGKIVVAYNVLGSYADDRAEVGDTIEIILPADFPTTMMRTVFVSKATNVPDSATAFVRHMIDFQTQRSGLSTSLLPPLNKSSDGAGQSTIALEPALMTYLDRLKRQRFITEWKNAIIQ